MQIITPRQKITEAPRASYSIRTRGIHVDAQNRVGIGTETPTAPLQVKQDAVDTDVFRITDIAQQFQLRFRAQLRDTLIQAWNAGADIPETLLLNPAGGVTRVGPEGLGFFDGTVQTTAALQIVATFNRSASAAGGQSSIVSISAPGVRPGDIPVIVGNGLVRDVIPHSPAALTDQVRVIVTNASNDPGSSSTNFTVYVLRP